MSSNKQRVLFICLSRSTFVDSDIQLLKQKYDVREFKFFSGSNSNYLIPIRFIKQFIWLLKEIKNADLIFGWFVDLHLLIPAFFSHLFKKPLVAVVGGTDAMNIPHWKHGVFASSWRSPIAKYIYSHCDLILPVSETLISSTNSYTFYPEEVEFGLEKELKEINAKVVAIATGYDETFWKISNYERKPIVTTVAYIDSQKRIWIKGIDLFIRTAKEVPEAIFQIVGIKENQKDLLGKNLPDNLVIIGPKTTKELVEIYNSTSIYVQLSRIEGFPNVLCEAMLCGCIPVGSAVFGINEILEKEGYIINTPEVSEISNTIKDTLKIANDLDRNIFRSSILDRFPATKREKALLSELEKVGSYQNR